MSSSDDSLERASPRRGARDEVQEIKRASRLSNARSMGLHYAGRAGSKQRAPASPFASSAHAAAQLQQQHEELVHARQNSAQFEEAKRLRQALDDRERELKECRFEMKQMQSRLNVLQSSEKSLEAKISSATAAWKQSSETAEWALEERKRIVQTECDRLVRLVSGIERHTMHGHHAVASRTTIGLLLKTRHGLENLKRAVLEGTPLAVSVSTALHDESFPATSFSASASSAAADSQQVKADALDGALLEMCKHLEEENMRLESTLAMAQAELQELQRESASSKLIPHYRLAIVRARAHATNLADQLQGAQEDNRVLRDQLERALKDMSNNSVTGIKKAAIFEFLNFKAGGAAASTAAILPSSSSFVSATLQQSGPAAAKVVQKELADLDLEIETLQRRLAEKAKAKASSLIVDSLTATTTISSGKR